MLISSACPPSSSLRVHQLTCIDVLCREIAAGRRKLLVEMAADTAMLNP